MTRIIIVFDLNLGKTNASFEISIRTNLLSERDWIYLGLTNTTIDKTAPYEEQPQTEQFVR